MKRKNFISRAFQRRVVLPLAKKLLEAYPVDGRGSGWRRILETYTGAWQQDVEVNYAVVDAYWADFSCKTLIAGDISKMPPYVMEYDEAQQIWKRTKKRPVLRKPNHYQTTIEFIFAWIISQLRHGNTYVLKVRDDKRFIVALHVLDPCRVMPLITKDGDVYYRLDSEKLAGLGDGRQIVVPASEIIHDRMYCLFHHLVGVSPVFACGIQAMQGSAIINTSSAFFTNRGMPAGILTAPGHISDDTANRLKTYFDDNFTGQNAGKVAVLGDDLKFESLGTSATDSQLIEQLKMTGEMIAACYHVPGYKIGVGQMPTVNNLAALNQQYYEQCLQYLVEKMEQRLDEGLELNTDIEQCWFDTSVLMRMDPQTRSTVQGQKVKDGILAPDEARREDDLPPVPGGGIPYMQQQNYSLQDLALRSQRDAAKGDDTNVQSQAMNGAQVKAMQEIIAAVASKQLPPDAAKAALLAAFPLLDKEEVDAMIDPLANFTPAPVEAPESAEEPANEAEDEDADEDEAEDEDEEPDEESEESLKAMVSSRMMEVVP